MKRRVLVVIDGKERTDLSDGGTTRRLHSGALKDKFPLQGGAVVLSRYGAVTGLRRYVVIDYGMPPQ